MLKVSGLRRHFGGVWATNGVDLHVAPGELHALIGPNGAGKTTLIQLIAGAIAADEGSVEFDGRAVTDLPMHRRAALGLVRSYQITSIFPHLSTLENVCLAVQSRQRDWGSSFSFWRPAATDTAIGDEARVRLGKVGLTQRAPTLTADLSHGEQRALELAMTLATRPRLLLLDEPMAGMSQEESMRMADLLAGLKGKVAMVLVEHDMDIVFRLADRLSVLVAGRIVASGDPATVRDDAEVRRAYLGDEVVPPVSALLTVESLTVAYGESQVLFGLDLAIETGQVATLLGRNGMGKSTTVRALCGLVPVKGGRIRFAGQDLAGLRADAIGRLGIGLVPEGRQVFANLSVKEHLLAFAANRADTPEPWTIDKIFAFFPQLKERASHLGNQLSGGEQQMLAIGRALSTNPRLLILDEATEGLAPLIREEIWRCLAALREAGQTILVIDKYVERLIRLADHHTILERGQAVWRGSSAELDADHGIWHRYLGI